VLTAISVATGTLALDGGEISEIAKTFEIRLMLMGRGFRNGDPQPEGDAIFDTAVLLRDLGITSGAGIARNQYAGVNMNKRESFSIAACSSFGRAAIWS